MGRLIDAERLLAKVVEANPMGGMIGGKFIEDLIKAEPTAYDVDKVAIEISDYFQSYIRNCNLTEEDTLTMLYMEEHITKLTKGAVKDE